MPAMNQLIEAYHSITGTPRYIPVRCVRERDVYGIRDDVTGTIAGFAPVNESIIRAIAADLNAGCGVQFESFAPSTRSASEWADLVPAGPKTDPAPDYTSVYDRSTERTRRGVRREATGDVVSFGTVSPGFLEERIGEFRSGERSFDLYVKEPRPEDWAPIVTVQAYKTRPRYEAVIYTSSHDPRLRGVRDTETGQVAAFSVSDVHEISRKCNDGSDVFDRYVSSPDHGDWALIEDEDERQPSPRYVVARAEYPDRAAAYGVYDLETGEVANFPADFVREAARRLNAGGTVFELLCHDPQPEDFEPVPAEEVRE